MDAQRFITFVMVVVMFVASAEGRQFLVGEKDGWVLKPSEGYSHWSKRERFHVNDTLVFKFKEGSDSVLVVDKNPYYKCTKENPKQILNSSNAEFKLTHSGPFYFISGEADNCLKGQKLEIVVISVKHHHEKSPSPAPGPAQTWMPAAPGPSPSAAPKLFSGFVFLGLGVVFLFLPLF